MKVPAWMGVTLAVLRHYITSDVVDVVKKKAAEAITHGEWSEGERTAFVIEAAQEFVAATPTKIDDFLVGILAQLYVRKYAIQAAA